MWMVGEWDGGYAGVQRCLGDPLRILIATGGVDLRSA